MSSPDVLKMTGLPVNTSRHLSIAMLIMFCSRLNQNRISRCFTSSVLWMSVWQHIPAWSPTSDRQLGKGLGCLEATSPAEKSLAFVCTAV